MVPHHHFGSRLAIRPRNLPSSSSRLRRGYDKAPRGAVNFCRFLTLARSPACDAVKIRCRRRRTFCSACRQSIDDQSRSSSSGPFTTTEHEPVTSAVSVDIVMASNLPFGSGVVSQCCFTGSPDPRQHPFRSGISPYPASYVGQTDGGRPSCPIFLLSFDHRHSLLGSSFPRCGIGLPHGRLTGCGYTPGPHRDCHVAHGRDATGSDASYTPGRRCSPAN
jgi:hypothetical protein